MGMGLSVEELEDRVRDLESKLDKYERKDQNLEVEEHKQFMSRLNDSVLRNHAWLERSPVCTKIVDLDFNLQYMSNAGIKALRIDDVTPYYGKTYPLYFFPPLFKETMTQKLKTVKETGKILSHVAPIVNTVGEELWFHSTLLPVKNKEGLIDYIMVVSTEITERIKAEEKVINRNKEIAAQNVALEQLNKELQQSNVALVKAKDKAEKSDQFKSAFLANMSHEIRTPMNGILGFLNLLNETQLTKEEIQKYINIINQSGERLLDTVNNIVEVATIESGNIDIIYQQVDVSQLLAYYYSFFQNEVNSKGLDFSLIKTPLNEQLIVMTDKVKLDSVITNLIKNAIKFTEKGKIEFACKLKDEMLQFYVKDTGRGIPEERFLAVFDRFVQADFSITKSNEGSGLGLSISKAYVEMLGGEIWFESEINKGSTFYFTISVKKL